MFLRLCLCVCLYLCVFVSDFEGICAFLQQDVKQEKDTTPAEETKRQKARVGQEKGRKGMKIKLL